MKKHKHQFIAWCAIMITIVWATQAVAAQKAASNGVRFYPHQQVAAAFAKGERLVQASSGRAVYQVFTARRDGPGEVELHRLDTDIVYVVKGTATFVTGGKIVDARHASPNEVRGKAIQGGTPHHLSTGDIIIIPHDVPHWFEAVHPPFLYFVVKVR